VWKFEEAAAPKGGNVVSCKMSTWVGQYAPLELFCLWTKVPQNFFCPTWKGLRLIKFFLDVRYSIFRRYSRSKSKVIRNRAKIWTFFVPRKFWGRAFQKLYTRYHPCLAARRLEKFCEDIHTSLEVIEAHTLNFKPNFKFSRLKFFLGDLVPTWVCAR